MSRSNSPQVHPAGRPLPGSYPAEQDPQAWAPSTGPPRPQPQGAPQQTYAQAGYAEPPPGDAYAQNQGYHYPQGAPQADPYANAASQPRGYAPQHDPYGQQAQASAQQQAYATQAGYAGHPSDPGPHQARPGAAYNQWPAAGQDHRGYDLGSYAAGSGYGQQELAPAHASSADWGSHDPYAQGGHSLDQGAYAAPQGRGGALEQTYAEDEAGYETEEPRRGRSFKLAAVLAGAVVVGGGLAYAYSALLKPPSDGTAPLVKSTDGPFKVKPSDPGGKQFAHTDSKIMGRLGEGGQEDPGSAKPSDASASGEVDATGARKVPVLVVGRDGSIQPPAASEAADAPKEPAAKATVAVPGMTVIDGLGGAPAKPAAAQAADAKSSLGGSAKAAIAAEPQQPVVVSPPAAPKKAETASNAAPAPAATQPVDDPQDAAAAPAVQKKALAPKKTEVAAATGPQPTGAGYVVVLISVPASSKSRMDALKQFADMQQKYGTLLQDRTPDVQEANLGEKGTYHRLLVGPPGSRDQASTLCTQLKAQGYNDCWVTAY